GPTVAEAIHRDLSRQSYIWAGRFMPVACQIKLGVRCLRPGVEQMFHAGARTEDDVSVLLLVVVFVQAPPERGVSLSNRVGTSARTYRRPSDNYPDETGWDHRIDREARIYIV